MNNDELNGRKEALSEREKAYIRGNVREFMHANPARAPLLIRALDSLSSATTVFYNPRLQFATASLAIVFIAGSGTAFAAQNALPGDPLYGVKVNLEEPIQGAFATSAQAQANWNSQLAARRLSEAEQLAAQNKLTPSAASTIASGLDQATDNFDANVAQLATSSNESAVAANLESNMEATLTANTQVLSGIANAVPSAAPSIAPLLSRVKTRAIADGTARAQLDSNAADANISTVKAAAQQQLDAAEGQLSATEATSSNSGQQTLAAETALKAGQANLNAGDYGAALETLQAASADAQEANINAAAADTLQSIAGVRLPISTTTVITVGGSVGTTTSATSSSDTSDTSAFEVGTSTSGSGGGHTHF